MNSNVLIQSEGLAQGTKVFVGGVLMRGVKKIVIHPIETNDFVVAEITVIAPRLGIEIVGQQDNKEQGE